jgi:ABC-type Na+ efflux pump permease subunit
MTTGKFDTEDAPGLLAVALGAVGLTQIGAISLYGYSLADTAFAMGATNISWAAILIVAGLAWVSFTNEVGLGDYADVISDGKDPQNKNQNLEIAYRAAVVGLIAVVVGMVFVTRFNDVVTGSDIAGTIAAGGILSGTTVAIYGG